MIVLIAPEQDIKNEINILHQLFKAGLQHYHLRKPSKNVEEHCEYLNQIDKKYHDRIVLHQFHELIRDFKLKGIHFQEAKRRIITIENLEDVRREHNISISSSFHSPQELLDCEFTFDYHLLSPVFSSISKKGYQGRGFDVNHINKPIVGMGGASVKNLSEFRRLGYQGVGVLGGIWNNKTPLESFKTMKNHSLTN